jgi:hypothetical protein
LADDTLHHRRKADFFGAQAQIARDSAVPAERAEFQEPDPLHALSSAASDALGLWPSESSLGDNELYRLVVAATPSIRARLLFSASTGSVGSGIRVDVQTLPEFIYLLHKLIAIARDAGMATINYQTVSRLASDHARLLSFLSLLCLPVRIKRDRPVDLTGFGSSDDYRRFLSLLLAVAQENQKVGRVDWLKVVATRLAGRLEVSPPPRSTWVLGAPPLRAAIQRAMLGIFNDQLIAVLAQGRRKTSTDRPTGPRGVHT